MSNLLLPHLPDHLEPTRASLHAYAQAAGVIPRAHAQPRPKWWHISLKTTPIGLVTDHMAYPDGTFRLRMDLHAHDVVLETSAGNVRRFPMGAGLTGSEMGVAIIGAVADLGLEGEYATAKFESEEERHYDPDVASAFFDVLARVEWTLATHRASLGDPVGPLQVWPHGFDLAFEWFGTRTETYEEHGETVVAPAQLNLGFYPAGDAYLYSNPWPFEAEALTATELPFKAVWHTEGWQGTMLRYADVAGRPDGAARVLAYARAVFAAASPTLTA